MRSPSSRSNFRIRYSLFDVALAALSPLLALALRNAPSLVWSKEGVISAGGYCLVSLIFSLAAFTAFRIDGAIPRYLSVGDLTEVAKAVLLAELMTCAALFTFTRLDGIPRSTPAIHALVLGSGLLTARALVHVIDRNRKFGGRPQHVTNVILIGLNDLSVLLMKLLQASVTERHSVIALLDEKPRSIGRSVNRVRVFGPPTHLDALIEEFATHGVSTNLVVVGSEAHELSNEAVRDIRRVCSGRKIELAFLSDLLKVHRAQPAPDAFQVAPVRKSSPSTVPAVTPSPYFRLKPFIDTMVAATLIIVLSPLWMLAAALALLDVGSPVVFWQQRIGQRGHQFHLYKFRTLWPSFDRNGHKIPEEHRLSRVGRLLRDTRLDEMPQLLNVLAGDMSLIGPRPLLTQDQPPNPAVRLLVRPGITGWAQVNGGTFLSATEKQVLDAWYIRHASPWIDLRIVWMTVVSFVRGDRRSEQALAQARSDWQVSVEVEDLGKGAPSLAAAVAVNPALKEDRANSAVHFS
jgi:lipopolysaccharide/colanic/teichoic acid biosynthesis glycosyltransferase